MKTQSFMTEGLNGVQEVNAFSYRLALLRHVPIEGEITPENVDWIITQCTLLEQKDPYLPITLYFNSNGGNLDAAYHLIDFIRGSQTTYIGIAAELCASAAAQIFASLPKGYRLIMPHAHILIHQPLTFTNSYLNSTNIYNITEILKKKEEMLYYDLAQWTGQSQEKIADDCRRETLLCGQEAVDYGLADEIYSAKRLKELEESVHEEL